MRILTFRPENHTYYEYSTDTRQDKTFGVVGRYITATFIRKPFEVDAEEGNEWETVCITPYVGRGEHVRKFIAIGRLTNPDFPFKLHPDSE